MYSKGFEGAWQSFQGPTIGPKEARADFDRWLAKHDLEAFDAGYAHGAEHGAALVWMETGKLQPTETGD
jgi:hypothetical protein